MHRQFISSKHNNMIVIIHRKRYTTNDIRVNLPHSPKQLPELNFEVSKILIRLKL